MINNSSSCSPQVHPDCGSALQVPSHLHESESGRDTKGVVESTYAMLPSRSQRAMEKAQARSIDSIESCLRMLGGSGMTGCTRAGQPSNRKGSPERRWCTALGPLNHRLKRPRRPGPSPSPSSSWLVMEGVAVTKWPSFSSCVVLLPQIFLQILRSKSLRPLISAMRSLLCFLI